VKFLDVYLFVMPGLVPGIHVFPIVASNKTWMAGTSPRLSGLFFAVQGARH